ncbi:hypothetical protein BKG71_03685 [Mycobacteroides chelonae]|nr:hypothetical protein BKG63_10940 [Mycobacteroides chelonae]OHU02547.1 hypothetical protein BKG71_03685 [Mycobacteroides chelonae]
MLADPGHADGPGEVTAMPVRAAANPCPICQGGKRIQVADVYGSIGPERDCLVAWELSTSGPCWCVTYGLQSIKEAS